MSDGWITFFTVVYAFVCVFLITVVLLQSGKGGGLGSAFGGGGGAGQQIFGGAGAGNLLTRVTAVCAAIFMILSATLSYLSSPGEQALDKAVREADAKAAAAVQTEGADEATDGTSTTLELGDTETGEAAETATESATGTEEAAAPESATGTEAAPEGAADTAPADTPPATE